MIPAPLFHYTCSCGHEALLDDPVVRPARDLIPPARLAQHDDLRALFLFAWFTDLPEPNADALGLTRHLVPCVRTRHRWVVISAVARPVPWTSVRRQVPTWTRAKLEEAPGAMPRHWFVSRHPVPVRYDPIAFRARNAG